jgi:hypothetical protein
MIGLNPAAIRAMEDSLSEKRDGDGHPYLICLRKSHLLRFEVSYIFKIPKDMMTTATATATATATIIRGPSSVSICFNSSSQGLEPGSYIVAHLPLVPQHKYICISNCSNYSPQCLHSGFLSLDPPPLPSSSSNTKSCHRQNDSDDDDDDDDNKNDDDDGFHFWTPLIEIHPDTADIQRITLQFLF